MAEFPTYEEMAKNIAEKVLDEFLYDGKSIREWMQIITSEDCISRQSVLNKKELVELEDGQSFYCISPKDVETLPSVTPIRPKGHWVLTDIEGNKVWHCHCSECGKDPQDYVGGSENWWLIKSKLPKFCPSCGSDNREVEE